jgi:hypothetical protein
MGDVIELDCITTLPIPPEKVLQAALDHGLQEVVVIGYTKDGDYYLASSEPDGGRIIWLLELAKKKLLEGR